MSARQGIVAAELPLILIVDDDDDTRQNLADILELHGYRVGQAATVGELFTDRAWDDVGVVLLDRKLPDGSPRQVAPRLRELAPFAAIIIVTGYADVEGAIAAVRSGATDYILKPVNADALLESIRRAIEHKQAEREIARLLRDLTNSEQRYRALFESTLDGLMIFDDRRTVLAANRAACAIFGLPAKALTGRSFESLALSLLGSDDSIDWEEVFFSTGKEGEFRYTDGAALASLEYRAVKNFAPGLHLISLRDVTGRKRAEERALQSQRLAAIGETMAALVHESRNALQRSKACLEMLTLDLEDRPEALKLVSRAQKAQDDLHRLYEEVRQWAAPIQLKFEACDLQRLWRKVWNEVCDGRSSHKLVLAEESTSGPVCEIDSFAMSQVFRNIFENAIDASPAGSTITVRCSEQATDGQVTVTIEDQGPGLKPEQLQRIFEPFFTTKSKGTGLGMAIVQRIVHSHSGTILASSPQGAKIEITLPKKHL